MASSFIVAIICATFIGLTHGTAGKLPIVYTDMLMQQSVFDVKANITECYVQMVLPQEMIINPYYFSDLSPICSDSFMKSCDFASTCSVHSGTCTNQAGYLQWTSAFYNGSQQYICGSSLQNFKDNYDSVCYYSVFEKINIAILNLAQVTYYGSTTDCEDMGELFNHVLKVLSNCDEMTMKDEFQGLFQAVVNQSPCNDQIVLSASTRNHGNVMLLTVAILMTLLYTYSGRD